MNDLDSLQDPDAPKVRAPLCRHVRCKGMYVTGAHLADPNALPYDATVWWCALTEKQLGPDFMPCGGEDCRAGRKCFAPADPT